MAAKVVHNIFIKMEDYDLPTERWLGAGQKKRISPERTKANMLIGGLLGGYGA